MFHSSRTSKSHKILMQIQDQIHDEINTYGRNRVTPTEIVYRRINCFENRSKFFSPRLPPESAQNEVNRHIDFPFSCVVALRCRGIPIPWSLPLYYQCGYSLLYVQNDFFYACSYVYASAAVATNEPSGNNLIVTSVQQDGSLKYVNVYPTGGNGEKGVTFPVTGVPDGLFSGDSVFVNPTKSLLAVTNVRKQGCLSPTLAHT